MKGRARGYLLIECLVYIGLVLAVLGVAYAALYLASDEASLVTAAILPVDGGMRLTGP